MLRKYHFMFILLVMTLSIGPDIWSSCVSSEKLLASQMLATSGLKEYTFSSLHKKFRNWFSVFRNTTV